jgi:hypothetical protein
VWNQNMNSFTHVTLAETGWWWKLDPSCCWRFGEYASPFRASSSVTVYCWWVPVEYKRKLSTSWIQLKCTLNTVFPGFLYVRRGRSRVTHVGEPPWDRGSHWLVLTSPLKMCPYGNVTMPDYLINRNLNPQSESHATPYSNNHFYWLAITSSYSK